MKSRDLTDEQWALIQPLLPPPHKRGRPRADDRQVLNGILYVLRTGIPWNDLPERYGDDSTCHRRLATWEADGTWERLWRAFLSTLDEQGQAGVDPSLPRWQLRPGQKGGDAVGWGRRGKGSQRHVITDGAGRPLAFTLTGAQVNEKRVALQTVDRVWVKRKKGRPKQRPKQLAADGGYDSRPLRKRQRRRRGRPAKVHPVSGQRWKVERAFAWLNN